MLNKIHKNTTVLTNNFSCECGGGSESRDPRPPLAQPPGGGGAVRGPAHLYTQPHDHCPAPAAPPPHAHAHQRTDHLTSYYTGDGSYCVCHFSEFIVDKKNIGCGAGVLSTSEIYYRG